MTEERETEGKLDRLVEVLIEETFAMSDQEILADAGEGVGEMERTLRGEIASAIAAHRRGRLLAAKDAVRAPKQPTKHTKLLSADIRSAVTEAIARRANDDASLTLAAREGQNVPDSDLEGLAEDMRELGFDIGEEEEPDAS